MILAVALGILLISVIGYGYWYYATNLSNTTQIESIAVMPRGRTANATASALAADATDSTRPDDNVDRPAAENWRIPVAARRCRPSGVKAKSVLKQTSGRSHPCQSGCSRQTASVNRPRFAAAKDDRVFGRAFGVASSVMNEMRALMTRPPARARPVSFRRTSRD